MTANPNTLLLVVANAHDLRRLHHCNACRTPLLAWFSSWVLASMSRRASFSCIGYRFVGGSSSSCAVSCTQLSTGSARTISSTSWVPSTAVVNVAVFDLRRRRTSLSRLRTKFGERAFTYAGPSAWNSLLKDLRAVTDPGLFRKRLKTHFFSLAFCICWQSGWLCNASMTYICNRR